jgi:hypothetical protein
MKEINKEIISINKQLISNLYDNLITQSKKIIKINDALKLFLVLNIINLLIFILLTYEIIKLKGI